MVITHQFKAAFYSVLIATLLIPTFAHSFQLEGLVVGVADGDTVTVLDLDRKQHKIRLAGIDAPEKAQPFGSRAKQRMAYLVYNKPVRVEYAKSDRYGRIVGKVWVSVPDACPAVQPSCPMTLDAGLALITVGLAWHYKQYEREQSEQDQERYSFAEMDARSKNAGLWQDKYPVPPWDWRKAKREGK